MDDPSSGVMFDADGYFFEAVATHPELENIIRVDDLKRSDDSVKELWELYYILMRSGLVLFGSPSEELNKALLEWKRASLNHASDFTFKHIQTQKPIQPSWITLCKPLQHALMTEYPALEQVNLTVTMEPRFHARALSGTEIVISSLTRNCLREFNMVLWSQMECEAKDITLPEERPDLRTVARLLLPYFIFNHDFIPVGRLPYTGTPSKEHFLTALITTQLQAMFIVAHEYGHIALGHLPTTGLSLADRLSLENDADEFAIVTLLKFVEKDEHIARGDVWIALRWLYLYQMLDEIVGMLLRGQIPDFEKLAFQERIPTLYRHVAKGGVERHKNIQEIIGSVVLLALKGALMKKGTEFVRSVSNYLSSKSVKHEYTWWEELPNEY